MPDSVVSAAVSSLERDKMPLMPVKREKEMAAITYQLRAACRDPALEMERAFDCERDFSRRQSNRDSAGKVKSVTGYILASEFRSDLERVCKNGIKPRDGIKIHVGNLASLVNQDMMNVPVEFDESDIDDLEKGVSVSVSSPGSAVTPVASSKSSSSSAAVPSLSNANGESDTSIVSAASSTGSRKTREERNAAEYLPRALLRVKLCVKKPFVTYDESYFLCNQIPDEYDSMVLISKSGNSSSSTSTAAWETTTAGHDDVCTSVAASEADNAVTTDPALGSDFRATYVIRDAAQVVPEYYIEFNVAPKGGILGADDDDIVEGPPPPVCGSCKGPEKNPAEFCIEEDGRWIFCKKCLDDLFEKLPMIKDQRTVVSLEDMKPGLARCSKHPERKAEWWCVDCRTTLCVACKVSGSHSRGVKATHTLVHVQEEYDRVRASIGKETQDTITEVKTVLNGELAKINQRSFEIEENVAHLLHTAQQRAQELEKQIKILGAQKLDSLRSRKHLAERNLRQIEWATKFANFITDHQIMPAEQFLESAPYHQKLIESLVENVCGVDEEAYLEKADLQLDGHLSVVIEDVGDGAEDEDPSRAVGGGTSFLALSGVKKRGGGGDSVPRFVSNGASPGVKLKSVAANYSGAGLVSTRTTRGRSLMGGAEMIMGK
eukprot:g4274.t1